jgi:hypothetical protein
MAATLSRGGADPARIVVAFRPYMDELGHRVTRGAFEENLATKLKDKRFDSPPLLAVGQSWDAAQAAALVIESICPFLR